MYLPYNVVYLEDTFGQYLGVCQIFHFVLVFRPSLTCVHTIHFLVFTVLSVSTVLKYDTYIIVNITKLKIRIGLALRIGLH